MLHYFSVKKLREEDILPNCTTTNDHKEKNLLTKREVEVLSAIAEGKTSQEAATNLFLSKRTIDFHLANIYFKLRVANRVQALLIAFELGIL